MLSTIGLTLHELKGKDSADIARRLHSGQIYGNGSDFFDTHTIVVTQDAVALAKAIQHTFELTDNDINIIEKVSYYHDSIEDGLISREELRKIEGEEIATMVEKLNKRYPDGSYKPDYYPIIAEDIRLKIIKFCDRRRNIQATIQLNSLKKILHHLKDYNQDRHNYYRYDIGADALSNALTTLQEGLVLRQQSWYMKKNHNL